MPQQSPQQQQPGGGAAAAGPTPALALHLLQGQVCRLELVVTNTGKLPIEEAGVSVAPPAGKGARRVTITVGSA
jgi:hypothetical protein